MTERDPKKGGGQKKTSGYSPPRSYKRSSGSSPHPHQAISPLGYRYISEVNLPRNPIALRDIIPSLLVRSGATRQLSVEKFRDCWQRILDDLLIPSGLPIDDGDIELTGFRGGVLSFDVVSAPLVMALSFYQREVLRRFQQELPSENIKKLRFNQK